METIMAKKKKKNNLPFGGIVANIYGPDGSELYMVCIEQTPKAHAALTNALMSLKMSSGWNLTLADAERLRDEVNRLYKKNPDKTR